MDSQTIGETLPLALGIAISPITIIAAILMLLAPQARRTSPGFLLGWVLGIAAVTAVAAALAGALPPHDSASGPNVPRAIVQLVLALLFAVLAVRQWRGRPRPGTTPDLPAWMAAIDQMTFARALGLGLILSALNPKNLLISASAGVIIGGGGLTLVEAGVSTGIFVLCAAATVWLPIVAFLIASDRMRGPLDTLHRWLVRENHTIMTVLLMFLAVLMAGKGIASL